MASELISLLRCPATQQTLRAAETGLVESLNQRISAGLAQNVAGQKVTAELDGGLVRADGNVLYPIRQEIPVMLVHEAIPL